MSNQYGPRIVTDGLILYLDAGNSKSYPGSGNTWFDLSGNGNHGTLTNIVFNTENGGNLRFDLGSTDYIKINHNQIFNFNGVFTISIWLKINTLNLASIYNIISKKANFNQTQPGWSCQLDYRATGILQFRSNNGTTTNDFATTSSTNNTSLLNQIISYKNIVFVINSSSVSFYLDSLFLSTSTAIYQNIDTNNDIYIGKILGSTGDISPPMSISQVSIYNRAISSIEIQQNYNATKGRFQL